MSRIALVTLVVDDYDEAIRFYVDALGFRLAEDESRGDGARWVVVVPPGADEGGTGLLLARAKGTRRAPGSVTRPVAGSGSFCTPTTSPATTPGCSPRA